MSKLTPPLKWHGGKHDLAEWIIGLMPPRCLNPNKPDPTDAGWLHYVEPYFGGGSVLLAMDPEGVSEVANDINGELSNFWGVLQSPHLFDSFRQRVSAIPFSEEEWKAANACKGIAEERPVNPWGEATRFFIRCRQSLSGRMKGFAGITRARTRRGMNEQVSAWLNCVDGLAAVHERLKRVLILNRDALDVIRKEDGPRTLFYLDPPYLHETRATTGEYAHEMTYDDHRQLLEMLARIKGRFLLSGYPSSLYAMYERDWKWTRHEKQINNHAAGGKTKRVMTECVWANF